MELVEQVQDHQIGVPCIQLSGETLERFLDNHSLKIIRLTAHIFWIKAVRPYTKEKAAWIKDAIDTFSES